MFLTQNLKKKGLFDESDVFHEQINHSRWCWPSWRRWSYSSVRGGARTFRWLFHEGSSEYLRGKPGDLPSSDRFVRIKNLLSATTENMADGWRLTFTMNVLAGMYKMDNLKKAASFLIKCNRKDLKHLVPTPLQTGGLADIYRHVCSSLEWFDFFVFRCELKIYFLLDYDDIESNHERFDLFNRKL